MFRMLKDKRAETLLEVVLSILIFAIVVLGVATMTGTSQNIAKSTAEGIAAFDAEIAKANEGSGGGPSEKTTFTYTIDGASGEFEVDVVKSDDGRLVTLQ